jgi:hypothetical protein
MRQPTGFKKPQHENHTTVALITGDTILLKAIGKSCGEYDDPVIAPNIEPYYFPCRDGCTEGNYTDLLKELLVSTHSLLSKKIDLGAVRGSEVQSKVEGE